MSKQFSQMLKESYLKQFSLAQVHNLVLFDPEMKPNQVLPIRASGDLGAMAMNGYSTFPKASALLEPHYPIS